MALVHKSVEIRPEIWRKLRVNAELSGFPLRDFLSFIIETSSPVIETDGERRAILDSISQKNWAAAREPVTQTS